MTDRLTYPIGGQAVDIRTSGVTVMRRMPGLEELVRSHHAGEDGIGFVDECQCC